MRFPQEIFFQYWSKTRWISARESFSASANISSIRAFCADRLPPHTVLMPSSSCEPLRLTKPLVRVLRTTVIFPASSFTRFCQSVLKFPLPTPAITIPGTPF